MRRRCKCGRKNSLLDSGVPACRTCGRSRQRRKTTWALSPISNVPHGFTWEDLRASLDKALAVKKELDKRPLEPPVLYLTPSQAAWMNEVEEIANKR